MPVPPAYALAVLGYPDVVSAADAVPAVLATRRWPWKGWTAQLVDVVRRAKGPAVAPPCQPVTPG